MVCPMCPTAGFLGGFFGSFIGVNMPPTRNGKVISVLTTASLVALSIIALKVFGGIALCQGAPWTFTNIVIIMTKTLLMGVVYSIGVNYFLNRFIYNVPPVPAPVPACCRRG